VIIENPSLKSVESPHSRRFKKITTVPNAILHIKFIPINILPDINLHGAVPIDSTQLRRGSDVYCGDNSYYHFNADQDSLQGGSFGPVCPELGLL
jgi:hypothetical protein